MTQPSNFTRRSLIKGIAASSLIPLLGSNLIGCSDDDNNDVDDFVSVLADFLHGIASGDPLEDAVIIWTRLTPETEGRARVSWEVATDENFSDVVTSGSGETNADVDYTVKVDVQNLTAGSMYYYRFKTGNNVSAIGSTRTLPQGNVNTASFAVVSCSNYPAGFFNVYREVANQDVDAVIHLGDYLYEYGTTGFASEAAEAIGRVVEPATEIISLSDYRTRYAQYHTDVDLQAAHAAHPFIVVWDDHEVANNSWKEGAQNHDPETEGSYAERKLAAIQAWYEWLPVRPPATEQEIIYRSFHYGDLLDLIMLDTRIIGRDEQNLYTEFASGGMIDVELARASFNDSNRSLLGATQRDWLRDQLSQSTASWQVLGQQVLLGRYHLPSPIMEALDPSLSTPGGLAKGTAAVIAAIAAKEKAPEDRSAEEQALLDSAIPYNLDGWDGYAYERDDLLSFAQQMDLKLVTLAGDTHNAWTTQLTTKEGMIAGVEFGAASVSSPGLEGALGTGNAALFGPLIATLVDDLKAANLLGRGYLHIQFSADELTATHRFIDNIGSRDYTVDAASSLEFTVKRDDLLLS
ncbi:MAG: alkaline phosphatase D [Halioglobus sp.]|jgi:alkaline phosphatase D